MSGIQTIAADVTVLAPEGATTPSADESWTVFCGGPRRSRQLALRRREVLSIPHANDNALQGRSQPRLRIVPGAPAPSPARGIAASSAPAGESAR